MLDMFAPSYDQEAAPQANEGRDLPATFGESFEDAWQNGQTAVSGIKQDNARNQAIANYVEQIKGAGGDFDGEYAKQAGTSGNWLWATPPDPLTVANTVVDRMKASATAAGKELPFQAMTSDDIDNSAVQISQGAIAANAAMGARQQTLGSRVGGLLGGAASATVDPYNLPALALPLEGLGVAATAGLMGMASVGSQTASEIANTSYNEKVQPGYAESHQAFGNIAEAGASGAVMGGSIAGLGKLLSGVATRFWPTAAKDAANGITSEANTLGSNASLPPPNTLTVSPMKEGSPWNPNVPVKAIQTNGETFVAAEHLDALDQAVKKFGADQVDKAGVLPGYLRADGSFTESIGEAAKPFVQRSILPGAEGEAAHQAALGQSIDQVLKGDPVDVSSSIPAESDFAKRIGDLSGDYGTTATVGGPYARDTMRLNEEPQAETLMAFLKRNGGVQDSGGSLKAMDMVKGYPGLINKRGMDLDTARELAAESGYLGSDTEAAVQNTNVNDLLDRLGEGKVYSVHDMGEVGRAGDAAKFNEWMGRRDDAVTEIQNHVADEGGEPLDEEHADLAAEHRMEGKSIPDAIEHSAADLYVRDAAQARQFREAPEMPEIGYEPPSERPQGYEGEPGAGDYYSGTRGGERPGAEGSPGPAQEALRGDSQATAESLTDDQIHEAAASPQAFNAMRADVERAIDEAAQSGKALQVPIGIDADGNPIMGSVTSALSEIDRLNELADAVEQCALPGAMQQAEAAE